MNIPRFYPESDKGEVYGLPGVKWQQRGYYFDAHGGYVSGDPDREREVMEINTTLAAPTITPEAAEALRARLAAITAPVVEPVVADHADDSDELLKQQLAIYDEPWRGRKAALAFLERGR